MFTCHRRLSYPAAGRSPCPPRLANVSGFKGGDVVILEDRGNEIALKPGMVLEVQQYSDDQIAQWTPTTDSRIRNGRVFWMP